MRGAERRGNPVLALRHRRVMLLVVDHRLQGGVDGEVEGLAFDLRGAGQVGWRAGWAVELDEPRLVNISH